MSLFITFEGLDGSGKSTQVVLLETYLRSQGHAVSVLREPGGTRIGETIRTILLDPSNADLTDAAELFLFSASRSQLVESVIRPSLREGTSIICDRFYDSTTAYQGGGRGLDTDMIRTVNSTATGGLFPDATFFLDVPLDVLSDRMTVAGALKDRMEAQAREFHVRVRQAYLDLASIEERFHVLDGTRPIDDIARDIQKVCASLEGT